MTIDERIERLEHVTAAHIEQSRQDYAENRRLWREQQQEIAGIWRRMEERDRRAAAEMAEMRIDWDARTKELRAEMAQRDRTTDERITTRDSAIGLLVRQMQDDRRR